ncbi:MAG: DNA repair protein RecN, partial [Bacteroidales bacterium]|nr:DNA repair protein RecN [Bacteroidales bacterium]
KNYALIDKIEIDFFNGFSIITGETGAGKSILLGALSLILGQRADTGILKDKEKKCVIEGSFYIKGYQLESFFIENEIEYENESILRREISPNGKSRAFINDLPVNLNLLKDIGLQLVDIHSQHQSLNLNNSIFQLNVIDVFASNSKILTEYQSNFINYIKTKSELEKITELATKTKADFDFFNFQYNEIENAKLQEGEQESLEEEAKTLNNSEEIQSNLSNIFNLLSENEISVINALKDAQHSVEKISKFSDKIDELAKRINSVNIEIKDIAAEVELIAGDIVFDSERVEIINQRLDLIYALQQKHKVKSVFELTEIKNNLEINLLEINSYDEKIKKLTQELEELTNKLNANSKELSEKRKNAFAEIENYIFNQLIQLGMPNSKFKIEHNFTEDFTKNGRDKIKFLFSANKNTDIQDIAKVASGGEISRLMLSIKSLLSKSSGLPTIIFDEIDTGVSGEIADKMGSIMEQMSYGMQVVNITHLPQVAAKGNKHYLVYKNDDENNSSTGIKLLSKEERLQEIAKMLSGENITKEAIENAKVLLNN